eukprot:1770848-Prymnesium_polylepis.1
MATLRERRASIGGTSSDGWVCRTLSWEMHIEGAHMRGSSFSALRRISKEGYRSCAFRVRRLLNEAYCCQARSTVGVSGPTGDQCEQAKNEKATAGITFSESSPRETVAFALRFAKLGSRLFSSARREVFIHESTVHRTVRGTE